MSEDRLSRYAAHIPAEDKNEYENRTQINQSIRMNAFVIIFSSN